MHTVHIYYHYHTYDYCNLRSECILYLGLDWNMYSIRFADAVLPFLLCEQRKNGKSTHLYRILRPKTIESKTRTGETFSISSLVFPPIQRMTESLIHFQIKLCCMECEVFTLFYWNTSFYRIHLFLFHSRKSCYHNWISTKIDFIFVGKTFLTAMVVYWRTQCVYFSFIECRNKHSKHCCLFYLFVPFVGFTLDSFG